jgi:hydroxylamine reductase
MTCPMFCYQCEQTSLGSGCTDLGVCGKEPEVSALQDLLIYQLEGMAFWGVKVLERGQTIPSEVHRFVIDALFSTLTNVNFDPAFFFELLRKSAEIKAGLRTRAGEEAGEWPEAARYALPAAESEIQRDAFAVDIRGQAEENPDVQSLKDTWLYGLKGMAAYAHHAWVLGYREDAVNRYFYRGLSDLLDRQLTLADLTGKIMEFGQVNLRCMELLDRANTETFGHPEPTRARISRKKGPFIVVSGHDLYDLKMLLEQTAGTGVQVYTHGEILPALAYPELKKYPHLVGNYGSAWQNQQREFSGLPGCILMTTNCLMEPRPSYSDRIFTTGVVGWNGIPHIPEREGTKDFSPLIQKALELGGWAEDEPELSIPIGFGRRAILERAGEIIEAVKAGKIRHFFLVGGCDGARAGRNYYTEFAAQTPPDTVVMTLACGKYRFNRLDLGTIAGLPRLLDLGQCNDAYSAIQVALALADAFQCSVNELPLTLVLSWYEQKAVGILLTLLSLGIQNIYLGPSLPAFISPNVLHFLVDQFRIHPISTPALDMAAALS